MFNDEHYGEKVDATVTVEEKKALAPIVEPFRHHLCAGKEKKEYITEVEEELALDAKLGLISISEDTAKKALKKDIDELTNSKQFQEISKKELEQLFKIRWMNLIYCAPHNIGQKIGVAFKVLFGTPILKLLGFLTILLIPAALKGYAVATWSTETRWHTLGNTAIFILITGAVLVLCIWMTEAFDFRYETLEDFRNRGRDRDDKNKVKRVITFTKIGVSLVVKPLDQTDTEIPKGAKIKAADAFDTKIFESFVIAYPKFEVQKHNIEIKERIIPRINPDPAICGVAKDGRLYMIVCWDIKKDIDKTKRSIKRFKKYKI